MLCTSGGVLLFLAFARLSCMGEELKGPDLLFDLNTAPYETANVYSTASYQDNLELLLSRSSYWRDVIGQADQPDNSKKTATWKSAGGIVPWIDDSSKRTIVRKYGTSTAPHIVIFLVDDWGWNDVGYQSSYLSWTTPNIDKLASKGIKLTNYYSHEMCVPSRAALMTGRYPLRFGMHGANENEELYLTEVTVAEELKSAGYRTNIVGKWHLGMSSLSKTPTYRGFDHFYGFLSDHVDYWTKKYGSHLDLHNDEELINDSTALSEEAHSEFVYAAEAVRVINDHATNYASQPMFLYFSSQLMHTTWTAVDSYVEQCADDSATTDEQTYCAMSLMLDKVLTKITCALENNNMMDNTVFVMMSDNGGNNEGSNYPFRGSGGSMFRGGHSVPAFVVAPESLIPATRQGGEYAGQFHVTDWLPTLMGLASGGKWTGSYLHNTIDGVNMWDTIVANSDTKHTEIVHYLDKYGNVSMQIDMVKMVRYNASDLSVVDVVAPEHFFSHVKADAMTCDQDDDDIVKNSQISSGGSSSGNSVFSITFSVVLSFIVILGVIYVAYTFQLPKEGYESIDNTKSYAKGNSMDEDERTPLKTTHIEEGAVGHVYRAQATYGGGDSGKNISSSASAKSVDL